ncbi:MAG: hypothetical protein KA792_05145 [Bacteroidales bacterium]|nr:hypothetical protein [Bacteroidales bacterium]
MGTRVYKIVKESRDKILILFTAIIIIFISFDLYREALSYINILYPKDDIATNDSINPVIYRVQFVAAFKRQLNKDSLSKDYNINKEIREDYHYEWYKYSIGYFDDFPQAKTFRDSLAKNNLFQGSFIVCFRNNQRLDKLVILKKYKPKTAKTIRYAAKASQIEFKIQIYASYNKRLPIDSLANVFNINQNIREDFLNGYYKYSTGSFDNFNKAKNYLTELKINSKLADAFIVAYKDNQRLDNIAKAFIRKPKTITSKQEEQNVEVKVEKIKPVKEKKKAESFYSNIPIKPKRKLSKKELAENNLRIADSLRTDSFNRVVTLRDSLKRDSIRFFYYLEAKVDSIRSTIVTTPQPDYSYVTLVMLSFAKKYNTKVYNIMSAAYERRSPTDRLIIILFFLIHFFALNFFLVSVISVFILIFKRIRDKKAKVLADKYRDILAEYIFYDELESSIPDELKSVNSKLILS